MTVQHLNTSHSHSSAQMKALPSQGTRCRMYRAMTDPLEQDDYEAARRFPASRKFRWDRRTTGLTYAGRHSERSVRAGRWAKGIGWGLATIPAGAAMLTLHAVAIGSFGGIAPLFGLLWTGNFKSRHVRSADGVREDVICNEPRSIRLALNGLISSQGRERFITGGLTPEAIDRSCRDARANAQQVVDAPELNDRLRRSRDIRRERRRLLKTVKQVETWRKKQSSTQKRASDEPNTLVADAAMKPCGVSGARSNRNCRTVSVPCHARSRDAA